MGGQIAARSGIAIGAFDTLTEPKLATHIFVADTGDSCEIADGLPQTQQ